MGLFDFFGGGDSSPNQFSENPTGTPGFSQSSTDFNNLPSMDFTNLPAPSQNSENPGGTPLGLDFSNTFGFTPSSFTSPSAPSGSTFNQPGITQQPNSLGGTAAPTLPGLNTGQAPQSTTTQSAGSGTLPGGSTGPNVGVYPAAPAQTSGGSSADSILGLLGLGTGSSGIDNKLLGAGVSGAGLLTDLLSGSPSASAEKQLKNIAGQQNSQGQQLESYLANGTLPPGAQQWVNQQTQAQKAAIRAQYAASGESGSTMEAQALNQVDAAATSQMFTIASQLLNTGISETNASGTLYNYLMQAQNADAKDVSAAIQNFVGSLGGGGSGGQSINLKVG